MTETTRYVTIHSNTKRYTPKTNGKNTQNNTTQNNTIRYNRFVQDITRHYDAIQYIAIHYIGKQYITEEYNKCDAMRYETHYTTLHYVTNKYIRNFTAEWNPTKRPLRRDEIRNMQYARNKTRDTANKKQCSKYSTQFTITFTMKYNIDNLHKTVIEKAIKK